MKRASRPSKLRQAMIALAELEALVTRMDNALKRHGIPYACQQFYERLAPDNPHKSTLDEFPIKESYNA